MRVIVTGSRAFDRADVVAECLRILGQQAAEIGDCRLTVVHGACPSGADAHAERWVRRGEHPAGLHVTAERHPATWKTGGKGAGFRRNREMAALGADLCLAFSRDSSPGTAHMIRCAEEAEIPTKVIRYADLGTLFAVTEETAK